VMRESLYKEKPSPQRSARTLNQSMQTVDGIGGIGPVPLLAAVQTLMRARGVVKRFWRLNRLCQLE
jgi:hypothetical protein